MKRGDKKSEKKLIKKLQFLDEIMPLLFAETDAYLEKLFKNLIKRVIVRIK
jgi:hypothetical protein